MDPKPKGFAAMAPERQRELARQGGKAVPPEKRSFATNRDLAVAAGRKGGLATPPEKRSFSQDRTLARTAGVKGGESVGQA
jgi:general stress protein YciG